MEAFLYDWLTVVVVASLAIVSPGPNYAVTLKHSLLYSRRAGIWTAVGVAAGNLVHVILSLLGVAVIVSQSVVLFITLKWLGAVYLVYLGVRSLTARRQEWDEPQAAGEADATSPGPHALRTSFFVSALNPKVTLFYLVLFTQIVEPATPVATRAAFGLTAVALSFAWYALVAVVVSHKAVVAPLRAVAHWIERATGAVLIVLGLRLALSRSH